MKAAKTVLTQRQEVKLISLKESLTKHGENPVMKQFTTQSEKGAFGEFVYRKYVKKIGFDIKAKRICEYDFEVISNNKIFRVDVKTTIKNITIFPNAQRVSKDIAYDLIVLREDKVYLFPDINSPIKKELLLENCLGNCSDLYSEYIEHQKKNKKLNKPEENIPLKHLKNLISDFATKYNLKISCLYRGPASERRWNGKQEPHNLVDNLIKSDYVIFFRMTCINFEMQIKEILLFDNKDFEKIEYSDKGFKKNGAHKKLINLDIYKIQFPSMVFSNINEIFSFLELKTK